MRVTEEFRDAPEVVQVLERNANALTAAFAEGLRPPPKITVSAWAEQHRYFDSESAVPGRYRAEVAPYLTEPQERLSVDDPAEVVTIIKCAQSGGSVVAENWIGYIADIVPGPTMIVQATFVAAQAWAAEKLRPTIAVSPRLDPRHKGAFMGTQVGQGRESSNKTRLQYRRGSWLLLAGANSAASLQQHSIRFAIEDDLDRFPDDLEGQGSPEAMVTARLRTYTRQGLSKRLKISTPTIKGASKIFAAWDRSDQRRFYLVCPGCAARFDPQWQNIIWERDDPEGAHLVTPCCGTVVEHWQKAELLRAGRWLSTVEVDGFKPPQFMTAAEFDGWSGRAVPGRQPGYHITGLISSFLTWGQLARGFVDAQGDVNRLKAWTNLELGDAFELRGDAPAAESLVHLCEAGWRKGASPWGPSVSTMGCDIQGDGIYYELVAWGDGLESWTLDHGFLPGATDVAGEGAWERLEQVAKRNIQWPGGRETPIDQICVDGGYNTEAAKAFCKRNARRMVVFGRPGWTLPILGRGNPTSYTAFGRAAGRATKSPDDKAFLVGTFGAKLAWFGYLRSSLQAVKDEASGAPRASVRGRVHFGDDCGEDYFDQLTSEACVTEVKGAVSRRVWRVMPGRQNHYLDCRIYNLAAAEALRLSSLTPAEWVRLQHERCSGVPGDQLDLISLATRPIAPPPEAGEEAAAATAPQSSPAKPQTPRASEPAWINTGPDWI